MNDQQPNDPIVGILNFIVMLGTLVFMLGPVTLAYQIYFWLRYGTWLPLTILVAFSKLGISYPQTEWGGIQKIIDWLMNFPLSIGLLMLPIILILIGGFIASLFRINKSS
jgi:hypothetical protein